MSAQSLRAPADYVDRCEPHYVYRCYDADGDLLYIGCTVDVRKRMNSHRRGEKSASRWLKVCMTRHEIEGPFAGRVAGRAAERAAIQAEQPLFNFQHRNGVGFAAWMTTKPIARYLVERGHLELAVETTCECGRETRESGAFDTWCFAHVAAQVAGITDLVEYDYGQDESA